MMEHTIDDSIESLGNVDPVVVPAGNNLRHDPSEHSSRDLSSWIVQD